MIDTCIAYDIEELEKKKILFKTKILYKSKLISKDQWEKICEGCTSKIYTPTLFMRLLLFIVSYLGFLTTAAPLAFIFQSLNQTGFQILFTIVGILLLFLTEKILIKSKHHYLSGVTEAGLFSGVSFIALGILLEQSHSTLIFPLTLFTLTFLASIRYLNRITLLLAVFFLGWMLFHILINIGGYAKALIPFAFMLYFGSLYLGTIQLEKKITGIVFQDFHLIIKSVSLLFIYISGNYFVVRELSISIMKLSLTQQENIPFAYLFYAFTILIPLFYIYWGVAKKSILFIRTGLITIALSAITLKYYFSLGAPMITITISGIFLIVISLLLFNYLKKSRNGFTRENIILNQSHSKDLTAFVSAQILGGNATTQADNTNDFGGGGANSDW